MKTIITIEGEHQEPGFPNSLVTTVDRGTNIKNTKPRSCYVCLKDGHTNKKILVDPKELIELGKMIERLYK